VKVLEGFTILPPFSYDHYEKLMFGQGVPKIKDEEE